MKAIDFKEATKVLQKPSTMTDEQCKALPVWSDGVECISCWKVSSFQERAKIALTGKVWLGVLSGKTQPPVFVTGERPFSKAPLKSRIKAFLLDCGDFISNVCENVREAAKQSDKHKHFFFGFLLSLVFGGATTFWVGFLLSTACGAFKEWIDSKGFGTVEVLDFVFTAFGALAAIPFAIIAHYLIF